jgi:hypothetical protein
MSNFKESFRIGGLVIAANTSTVRSATSVSNQVTNEGIIAVLSALSAVQSIQITNMFLLNGFQIPQGVSSVAELTFDDIKDFIAPQAFVGNNSQINSDGSRDMRTYLSQDAPYEATYISTIPSDRANENPTFNASALVIGGDAAQSTSNVAGNYTPTGTEVLFSIALFNEVTKDPSDTFTVLWYVRCV